ncbi:hypothetical protein KB270_002480 [Escherichia coli]|nr:hypothetical protein [Escherichia coli]
MNNKSKIILFAIAVLLSMSAYVSLYFYQFGRGVLAEWWLLNVTQKKIQIAESHKGKRVFIVAGSSGIFGFNSDIITERTGFDVINMSMHAGLDLSYYRMIIEKTVRGGDTVIMPLEFSYYRRADEYTGWFVDNIMAWGSDYLKWNTIWKNVEFFSHVSLSRVVTGLVSPIKHNYDSLEKVMAFSNPSGTYNGYSYKSLNARGDINRFNFMHWSVKELIDQHDKNRGTLSYGNGNVTITSHTMRELLKIKNFVESRGALLYISWPTTMQTKYFNPDNAGAKMLVDDVKEQLSEKGFKFLCDPFYANLPQFYFLDTYYHLNGDGAKIRSERFSQCLNDEMK